MTTNEIKNYLEDYFHISFDVELFNDEFMVTFSGLEENFFYIKTKIKNDIRLIITIEPQRYAKQFVETINHSNGEKRKIFSEFWKQLGENKLNVTINGASITCDEFVKDNRIWNSFSLRYSISPYYEKEDEKTFNVFYSISTIIAMMLSICEYSINGYAEGKEKESKHKSYERNPINRRLCLLFKGYRCSVCGFDFEKSYGEIGKNFIEVHHSLPVSLMEENHIVDPIKELYPLCPNCHAMVHRRTPPYSIEELKDIMDNARKNDSNRYKNTQN